MPFFNFFSRCCKNSSTDYRLEDPYLYYINIPSRVKSFDPDSFSQDALQKLNRNKTAKSTIYPLLVSKRPEDEQRNIYYVLDMKKYDFDKKLDEQIEGPALIARIKYITLPSGNGNQLIFEKRVEENNEMEDEEALDYISPQQGNNLGNDSNSASQKEVFTYVTYRNFDAHTLVEQCVKKSQWYVEDKKDFQPK